MRNLPRVSSRGLVAFAATMAATAGLVGQSVGAPTAEQVQATGLQQQLDTLLTDPRFTGSQVGLVVRDATTGETLVRPERRDAAAARVQHEAVQLGGRDGNAGRPASGSTPTYWRLRRSAGGKLRGDLYLKGYGDPTALESDYVALAKQIAAAGVRRVDGEPDRRRHLLRPGAPRRHLGLGRRVVLLQRPDLGSHPRARHRLRLRYRDRREPARRHGRSAGASSRLVPANGVLKLVNTATTGAAGSSNTLQRRA